METPEEKAKRLGVPLQPMSPVIEVKEGDRTDIKHAEAKMEMMEYLKQVVSVCECGKEITRLDEQHKVSCGDQRCPFGYETNNIQVDHQK